MRAAQKAAAERAQETDMSGQNGTREATGPARTGRGRTALNARIGRTAYAPETTPERLAAAVGAQLTRLLARITDSATGAADEAADAEHDYALSLALGGRLDAEWPVGRRGRHESIHETFVRKESEPPHRGELLIDSSALGIRVTVAKAWELRGRRLGDMRSWGLKLDIEETGKRGVSAPRNYEFGFFGSWQAQTGKDGTAVINAERAWQIVIDTLGSGTGTGTPGPRTRRDARPQRGTPLRRHARGSRNQRRQAQTGNHPERTAARLAASGKDARRRRVDLADGSRCGPP